MLKYKRNVQIGDIVLIQDSKALRGNWKLAEVCSVEHGRDGKVRDVELRYKVQKPSNIYQGQADMVVKRSVHRLVILLAVEER